MVSIILKHLIFYYCAFFNYGSLREITTTGTKHYNYSEIILFLFNTILHTIKVAYNCILKRRQAYADNSIIRVITRLKLEEEI